MPAFEELVDRFQGRLFNFLLRRLHCATDADDLTQDTFVRAWQQMHRYQPHGRFATWLFTIASRLAIDSLRSRKAKTKQLKLAALHGRELRSHESSADDTSCEVSRVANIWEVAAAALNDEQHTALWLRYAEDLSNVEIARVLGRTRVGVRVMLHRARAIIARKWNAQSSGASS
jgi:RNA polymerase sigma-70 factor (ECF subfamily)